MIIAWVASLVAAALMAALIILMLRGNARRPRGRGPAPPPTAEPRRPDAGRPTRCRRRGRPPRPPPRQPPLPSPSPAAVAATPSPDAPHPTPSPRPSPSAAAASAAAAAADTSGSGDDTSDDADLSGEWLLTNRVDSTDYPPYQGMRLGYVLTLHQDESGRITGDGEKTSENGAPLPPGQRSPIAVTGRVENGTVTLSFTEKGALRSSTGSFRWQVAPDHARLSGSFASDAAGSRGSSSAQRVR